MKEYFPYNPYNPKPVESEQQKVVGGQIRLDHVPKKGTLQIYGFEEVNTALDIQPAQFFCSYSDDTLYRDANRIVYFNRAHTGQTVICSYMAVASPVTADDMNEIETRLTELERSHQDLLYRVAKLERG